MTRKSDFLEREISTYWNAVVARDELLPPMSDTELARLIDAIDRSEDSEAPAADFTNRLFDSLAAPQAMLQTPTRPVLSTDEPSWAWPVSIAPVRRHRRVCLAVAALLVAVIGVSLVFRPDDPDEPAAIPAAVVPTETVPPAESGSVTDALALLSVDPDELSPGARETWTAASFRMFEIPAKSFYQFPDCPGCAVLVIVSVTQGSMNLRVDGPVAYTNQSEGTVQYSTKGQAISLSEHAAAVFDLQNVTQLQALVNGGDGPATLLVGVVYGEDFRIAAGGGTPPSLYSSIWALPYLGDGSLSLGIDRLEIGPGAAVGPIGSSQSSLYLLDQGTLTTTAQDPLSTPVSWMAPVGVQLDQLPPGDYELVNAGADASVLYRLTISGTAASDRSPTRNG